MEPLSDEQEVDTTELPKGEPEVASSDQIDLDATQDESPSCLAENITDCRLITLPANIPLI